MSNDPWKDIAAPLPPHTIEWRQDGKPYDRDGKAFARFVPYMTAQYARERLDSVVPGEWNCTLEQLPTVEGHTKDGEVEHTFVFKARVQILGIVREDVGEGSSPKGAATDSFKRACMRFGMAHELYSVDVLWVEVEPGKKFPKPLEDPALVYARKLGHAPSAPAPVTYKEAQPAVSTNIKAAPIDYYPEQWSGAAPASSPAPASTTTDPLPNCPNCSGKMWDNRVGKRNPKAPDFKCRDRRCEGVVWSMEEFLAKQPKAGAAAGSASGPLVEEEDDLPF